MTMHFPITYLSSPHALRGSAMGPLNFPRQTLPAFSYYIHLILLHNVVGAQGLEPWTR
jgi:hypothetical protein